jgi:large subunit ribosomal protein L31
VKPGIHPEYHRIRVTCACGATYEVGSTKPSLRVDVCARCHPFYTGKQRIVDTGGRVERFLRRYERTKAKTATAAPAGEP